MVSTVVTPEDERKTSEHRSVQRSDVEEKWLSDFVATKMFDI